jgi:preprotein translocase subunit SecD
MARRALELSEAAALVTAAVRGAAGEPRQVVAAAVAAAMRVGGDLLRGTDQDVELEQQEELAARVRAITPALARQVAGRPVSGDQRLVRNVASHVGFGEGPEFLSASTQELRRRQRGRRNGAKKANSIQYEGQTDEAQGNRTDCQGKEHNQSEADKAAGHVGDFEPQGNQSHFQMDKCIQVEVQCAQQALGKHDEQRGNQTSQKNECIRQSPAIYDSALERNKKKVQAENARREESMRKIFGVRQGGQQ